MRERDRLGEESLGENKAARDGGREMRGNCRLTDGKRNREGKDKAVFQNGGERSYIYMYIHISRF